MTLRTQFLLAPKMDAAATLLCRFPSCFADKIDLSFCHLPILDKHQLVTLRQFVQGFELIVDQGKGVDVTRG